VAVVGPSFVGGCVVSPVFDAGAVYAFRGTVGCVLVAELSEPIRLTGFLSMFRSRSERIPEPFPEPQAEAAPVPMAWPPLRIVW
jgi:hypothetical protein